MRYLELDAMRGIAAMAVVLFHFTTRYLDFYPDSDAPIFKFDDLGYGVNLFFVISGFVISFSAAGKNNALAFVKGRILRLYPLYWVAMIITFVVLTVFPHEELTVGFTTFLVNFSMLQKFAGFDNVDGAYWTLAIEWVFYFIIIGMLLIKQFSRIFMFVVFLIVANVGLSFANNILGMEIILPQKLQLVFSAMGYFACGVCFYLYKKTESQIYVISAFLMLVCNNMNNPEAYIIMDFALFWIFWLFTTGNLKWIAIKPLVYLGNLSYALYLIHQNIGYVIINKTTDLLGINLAIVLAIICMMVVAHFMNELTNKAVGKFLKKRPPLPLAQPAQ